MPDSARVPAVLSPPELAEYLLELGGALLSYGCPTHRLEQVIRSLAELEGCAAEAFAVPTGLWMSLRAPGDPAPMVRMLRVKEWAVDLERLALIDKIFNDVIERRYPLAEARRQLDEVERRGKPYPAVLSWLAPAGTAGASAVFFRGGLGEVAVAAFGGALIALTHWLLARTTRGLLLHDFVGGVIAAALASGATALWPTMSREVLVLSVIILLVPGMALTTGLAELAHKNLVSGGGRLMEAMMVFLFIVFGIAVVIGLEQLLGLPAGGSGRRGEPGLPWQIAALLVASFGFGVIFAVPRSLLVWAMLSGALAWIVTGLGTRYLPGSLPAFTAALSISLYANICARVSQRPAQVFQLPGLVLLVPGSFGFLSLEAFLRGEFLGGAAKGFEMFLVAGAIVTGLLVANVLFPARKLL